MQILINGMISGSVIALLAVAFQSVYLPTRVFFVGLAGIYAAAPFIALEFRVHAWPWVLSIAASVMSAVVLSVLFEWSNHARLARRKAGDSAQLISSLGIYIATVQIVALVWGNDPRMLRSTLDSVSRFGDVVVTGAQSRMFVISIILLVAFALFLRWSNLGLRIRAMADNPVQFVLFGFNVDAYRYLAFGLAGCLTAAASDVTAYDNGFDPNSGLHAVLLAVVAVIIGGQGSFLGPVLGGFALGILRAQVVWYSSARWEEAATFGLLAVFLLIRPQGMLGRKIRLEATT